MEDNSLLCKDIEIQADLNIFQLYNYNTESKSGLLRVKSEIKRNISQSERKNQIFTLINEARINKNMKNSNK